MTRTITLPKIMYSGQKIKINDRIFCAILLGQLKSIMNTSLLPELGWVEVFEQIEIEETIENDKDLTK